MAEPHNRKLKQIQLSIGTNSFECQVQNWRLVNNTEDGERRYTQCPDGEFREESDPDWAVEITFFADWRENGISDWLTANNGQLVAFQLDHLPHIPAEHVRWTGELYARAPGAGGDARTTESAELTMQIKGEPVYSRVGA